MPFKVKHFKSAQTTEAYFREQYTKFINSCHPEDHMSFTDYVWHANQPEHTGFMYWPDTGNFVAV